MQLAHALGWTAAPRSRAVPAQRRRHAGGSRAPLASRPQAASAMVEKQDFDVEGLEKSFNVRQDLEEAIEAQRDACLTSTEIGRGVRYEGKVRDTYDMGDKLVLVTTDRQSAFDRLLACIPFKGQVLNQTSAWWMERTQHIVPNALLSVPDPNVSIMRKLEVCPVEFVVRGYMTGSTNTSLWTHYKKGSRNYCGNELPDGMVKNVKLAANIVTPTTKAADHDVPITPEEIVKQGLMTQEEWNAASKAALELFAFGQEEAAKRGLILVDTKYEFARNDGSVPGSSPVVLVDEIHTPDSSRYWIQSSYEERLEAGLEPENIDKEFLRLWFASQCDPYADEELPEAPPELVSELSRRYIQLYETITGEVFVPEVSGDSEDHNCRIQGNVKTALRALDTR